MPMMIVRMMMPSSQALHAFRTCSSGKPPLNSSFLTCIPPWRNSSHGRCYEGNKSVNFLHMISRCRSSHGPPQFKGVSLIVSLTQRKLNEEVKGKAHFSSFACAREKGIWGRIGTSPEQVQKFQVRLAHNNKTATKMGGKGPGLIVFDLDCTLWPLHVDTTVNPPFIKTDSKIVDQDGKLITYYPEVPQVLEYLKSEGYSIGVASRTTKPPGAFQLLEFFDWNKYISYREIYPGSKVTHFNKFAEQTQLRHNEMLFFDDEERNIIDMEKEGVKCVLVKDGVDLQLVKDSIEQFKTGKL